MVTVPAATPVTTPVDEPIVAIVVLPLVHTPPGTALLNVVTAPTHTLEVPVMGVGNGFTVITFVAMQPAPMA